MWTEIHDSDNGVNSSQKTIIDLSGDEYVIIGSMYSYGDEMVIMGYNGRLQIFLTATGRPGDFHSFRYFSAIMLGTQKARKMAASSMLNRSGIANTTAG